MCKQTSVPATRTVRPGFGMGAAQRLELEQFMATHGQRALFIDPLKVERPQVGDVPGRRPR